MEEEARNTKTAGRNRMKAGKNEPGESRIKAGENESGKQDRGKGAWKWLFSVSRGQHGRILVIVLCNGLFAASGVWFALVCKGVIDHAVQKEVQGLKLYAAMLLGVVVLQFILRLVCNNLLEYVRSSLEIQVRQRMLRTLMKKEYGALSGYHSGELLNRMFSDVQEITESVTGILPGLANMLVQLVLAAGVLISIEPGLTLLLLVGGFLVFCGMSLFRKTIKRLHKRMKESEGRVRSFLQEAVESLLVVKVFGAEKKMGDEAARLQQDYFRLRIRKRNISICANATIQLGFRMGYFLTMMWGALGIFKGTVSYGSLTAVLQLIGQVQSPFTGLSGIGPRIYGMLASAERLMELDGLPGEEAGPEGQESQDERRAHAQELYRSLTGICFDGVCFSYGRDEVLINVSFQTCRGDFTAVTGLSGGGKSTLFLLMMGVYTPDQGSVYLQLKDSKRELGTRTRGLFAYVPQGNYLFSGTLRENVTMLREEATQEEIAEALLAACAAEFVERLPEGLETRVGERGHGFSEGQVQRIAVARALLSGAPVLLLDEATSALDEETEARMLKNISRMENRTCFIVTHRKAALAVCNKEIRIEDGKTEVRRSGLR